MNRLDAVAELLAIPSLSRHEHELADYVEARLRSYAHLIVERVGDNVVARTTTQHGRRVLVAGHLDTVPGDPATVIRSADRIAGLGACDMKGSLAVMLELAALAPRQRDVTWVFYAREEIARRESGLLELAELRPDLLDADAAIVAEPTGGAVEAGCQGTLHIRVRLTGARAHTARPFTGDNAIHRTATLIQRVAQYEPRVALCDGIAFTEQLQVVSVQGGVAPNVVPDECDVLLNHRVAPDRDEREAVDGIYELLSDVLREGDTIEVKDWAPAARPYLDAPEIAALVAATGVPPRAKVGWTDVATLSERGIPATNFGAGDPLLAHRADEYVTAEELDFFADSLRALL